jgi:hypothetical protein
MASKNRARLRCTGCDSKLSARDVVCRKCRTPRTGGFAATGSAGKALFVPGDGTRPFVVKMAGAASHPGKPATPAVTNAQPGKVVPISRAKSARTCWNGHSPGRPGDKYCGWCGQPYGLDYAGNEAWQLSKSVKAAAGPKTREQYLAMFRSEPNREWAEGYWRLAYPEIYGQGGSVS